MNYQDGYSKKALEALAQGKYKTLRSNELAHKRYTEGKKKREQIAVTKQNKTQNPTSNAMANDPGFFAPSVSLPVPTLPMVNAMQGDPRFQVQPEYNGDEVLNQLLGSVKSSVKESPNLSDMIPKQSSSKRSKAKPSTRYTNETVKNVETPVKPKFDSDMEKEFEEFFNYRYDQADVVDYDPVTQTDTEHWRNLKKDIMRKHGWSEKDFKKNYGEYEKYRHDTMKADYVKNSADFAEKVPVLPSIFSLANNIGSSLEGASTAIRGVIGNKNLEKIRNLFPDAAGYYEGGANDNIDTKAKEALRQGEREKIGSKAGQTIYDMAMGLGDMGVNTALGGGTPLGMGIASGLQNAAQNETHALERGIDEDWAARYGLATGAVAGLMNTVGLDSVLKTTGSSVIKNILSSAGKEGLENVAEDIADRFIDGIMNGENSEQKQLVDYYLQSGLSQEEAYQKAANDFFIQELTSFGSGALFGGLMSGAKNLPQLGAFIEGKLQERDARKNPTVAGILDGTITESPRVPDVVEQARAQAERAQGEVERLNQQLPEAPVNEVAASDTGLERNPTITERVEMPAKKDGTVLNYSDADSINSSIEANGQRMGEIETEIADLDKQLKDIPDLKKNKKEIYKLNKQKYALEQEQKIAQKREKVLNKLASGKKVNVKDVLEVEYPDIYRNIYAGQGSFLNDVALLQKFAGNNEASKAQAQKVRDAMYKYINGGTEADLDAFMYEVGNLDKMAQETNADYVTKSGKTYTYGELFDSGEGNTYIYNYFLPKRENFMAANQVARSIAGETNNTGVDTTPRVTEAAGESAPASEVPAVKNPIETDQENLNRLISSKKTGNVETSNGQVIEKYSLNDMKNFIKEIKENGGLKLGEQLDILYKDGTEVQLGNGDDVSNIKLTNIDGIVWRNESTDALYGNVSAYHSPDSDVWYVATGQVPDSYYNSNIQTNGESAPVETPESVVAELNQTPVESTNDTGVDNRVPTATESNVPPSNVPPTNNGDNDTGVSKLVTNSARNADIVSEYEYDNDPVVQNIAKYAKHNNETTFNNALDNVKQNGGKLLEEYNNGTRKIDNDQDVDQSMLILQGLTERMRAGEDVSAQRNLLLSKLRQAATTWGQNIQAFAKWNDTADGALINGDKILSGRTEEWESRNQKQTNRNKKVAEDLSKIPTAEYDGTKIDNGAGYKVPKVNPNQTNGKLNNALKKQGYDGTMDIPKEPKTREQIRREVVNSLKKEYGSIENQFSDQDIDYITNLINEGATTDELAKALNTKMATGAFGISADTQNKVNLLFDEASKYDPNSVDANRAKAAAYKLIADEVVGKATPYEKFEAWRYIAMLGNPKTMFRNFVGNTTFNVVTSVSNGLSGALEAGTDWTIRGGKWAANKLFKTDFDTSKGIERTKSLAAVIPTKKNSSLVKAAWDDAYEHRYNEMSGQKYEKGVQDKIRDSKSVFNSKWAQLYEKLTDAGISDTFAVRTKYSTSLAGYLRANGIDDGIFEADKRFRKLEDASRQRALTDSERADLDSLRSDHEKLEKARDYAVKEAEYATFHEDNKVAQLLSEFSTKARNSDNVVAKGIGYIFEGVMPFKKTPSNIVRSGYDFSPFGAISSIKKTGKLIYENTGGRRGNLADTYKTKSGKEVNKTLASDVIESWARNLTGTGMMMLGYYLTSKGILNSSKKDELYQDELEGKQNYSITINGHTYTIDWAAPASMSLLMGAELHKIVERNAIPGKKVYENVGDVIGTINSLIDPVVETSMMQGVKNTLETAASVARYDDNAGAGLGVLGTMAANAGLNYVSQVVPTILGQAARVIDPVRRSTDTVSPNSFVAGMEKQGRKMLNKLPFLSMLNNPYVNARGEEELNSPSANPLVSIPYQFISPGYLQEINQTEADKSAREVYNAGVPDDKGNIVPQMDKGVFETWKSKVTVGEHKFTPDEMYQYRTTAGQANEAIRTALAQEEWFSNLNPQAQNDLLKSVNTLVDKLGKETVGYPQEDKALNVYKDGGIPDLLHYYKENAIKKQVQGETGLSAQAKKTAEITDAILAGKTDEANQMIAEETQRQEALKPYEDPAEALGIKAQDYSYIKGYSGNSWSKVEPELPKLKDMGAPYYSQYAHAYNYVNNPKNTQSLKDSGINFNMKWFADQAKRLDVDKSNNVSQDELINFFNQNNMSQEEVMAWWGMFALGQDGKETQTLPHILKRGKNEGKWGK